MNLALIPEQAICLRDYQADAIDALRAHIRAGAKRLILCAATGAGKTVLASHLLNEAAGKGSYSLFMVDRVALVDQTSATLDEYGVRHGIVQGINRRWSPHEHVQVASIQTLARRSLPRTPNLLIWDEAHCRFKATEAYIDQNPHAVVIGLTATPFTAGMADRWDAVVNVRSARDLMSDGYLVEPTIYVAKSPEDAEFGLRKDGEFTESSASEAGIKIIGDVVSEWERKSREHFGGPVKTIVFSPTVDHGRELCEAFNAAGYNFQQITHLDRDDDRKGKIAEFRRPDSIITGLVSCGVLTRGFDVPDTLIGISCKPYRKSLSSHMQEIGRVMRPHPGKTKCLWLDHSGNIERFAADMFEVWDNGPGELSSASKRDSTPRKRDQQTRQQSVCPACSGALRAGLCLACGWQKPARSSVVAMPGELVEFAAAPIEARPELRAACLANPEIVWRAALTQCMARSRRGEDAARKWAFAIWKGIYPSGRLGRGWWDMRTGCTDAGALSLIEREISRSRKRRAAA